MPEFGILRCFRTAVRPLFEAEDSFLKAPVPFESSVGMFGVNGIKDEHQIAFRARRNVNEVGHAAFRIPRRTPSRTVLVSPSSPPNPGEFLQPRQPGLQYPEVADRPLHPARSLQPFP